MTPEAGLALYQIFQDTGLPAPHMHLDVPFAEGTHIAQLEVDLLPSLADGHRSSLADLGDLETLAQRIHTEAVSARSAIGFMAVVSAWSRKIN
jgi:hypothetical protein